MYTQRVETPDVFCRTCIAVRKDYNELYAPYLRGHRLQVRRKAPRTGASMLQIPEIYHQ